LAVVVQMLVPADAAGILFTANPVSGEYDQVVINAAWGLGEVVVGGAVTPDTLTVSKPTGRLIRRETGEKQVKTIRIESGTSEQPVPDHLKKAPVLSGRQAAELARLGVKIEKLYNMPMDIEWTLSKGRFAIVQARPITTLNFDENNDSLRGDFVWSNVNVGEAVSDVMTPLNWSVIRDSFKEISVLPGYNMLGNIGGCLHLAAGEAQGGGFRQRNGGRIRKVPGMDRRNLDSAATNGYLCSFAQCGQGAVTARESA
jgi:hypothetical protein